MGCASPQRRSSQAEKTVLYGSDGKALSRTESLLPGMTADASAPPNAPQTLETVAQEDAQIEEILREGGDPVPVLESASADSTPKTATEPTADQGGSPKELLTEIADDLDDAEILEPREKKKKRDIPFEFNQRVASWIQYFSQKDRERFQRFLDRGEPYREVVENILEANKVPADLYYLGLIESGFRVEAKSHAKAVGVWQFMKATGKEYGLQTDIFVDERQDPVRATEAAAKYLRDLYRQFGSWYLAMAAYNAGPGRIRGSIRRAGTDDFWELVSRKKLPQETMDYVPKYLAARYIGENPDLFAFYINEEKQYPSVELVKVPSPVSFASIEKAADMPVGTLEFVNPHYLKSHTHPGRKYDEIWVPTPYVKRLELKVASLENSRIRVQTRVAARRSNSERVATYRVKRGDTLKSIAKRQGLSVAYLKRVNALKSSKILPGQTLKLSASSYQETKKHPRKSSGRSKNRRKK
jgi:membrane-bound lytic murein transglycosylase D